MKGKRYTPEQKQEIVSFVEKHNAENGRGGQSAASAKFGVSQLTIAGWLQSAGSPAASKKSKASKIAKVGKKAAKVAKGSGRSAAPSSFRDLSAKLSGLVALDAKIQKAELELKQLRSKFDEIKASL